MKKHGRIIYKKLILSMIFIILSHSICFCQNAASIVGSLITTTIFNKNVYKTKASMLAPLTCTVAYKDKWGVIGDTVDLPKTATFSVQVSGDGKRNLRYKEIKTDGDFAYIRFIKKCKYTISYSTTNVPNSQISITQGVTKKTTDSLSVNSSTSTSVAINSIKTNTLFVISKCEGLEKDNINNYVFMINIKSIDPVKRYLASSNIIGKIVTMPLKYRQKYYDKQFSDMQTTINLNYCFGWKFKLGDHPYHSHYINFIPYAIGIGAQNYFSLIPGEFDENGKQKLTKAETQIAFTYFSVGLTYEYDRFNIGAFVGWDTMLKPYDNWAYNKKAWYGLGIGYDIFK